MNQDDWTGLGVSVGLHAILLLLFAIVAGAAEPEPLGLIEVEFGPFELAQPAALAETPRPTPTQPDPQPQPVPPAPKPVPQQTEPVNLPKQAQPPQPDRIPPPEPRETTPQTQTQPERPVADPAPTEQAGGNPQGTAGSTSETGDTGTSTTRRAPFSIDGLNRTPTAMQMPSNPGGRGDVGVNICVGPDGRLTRQWPAQRSGQPELDRAAQQALNRWRFNALPPAAPQEEQCGRITFFFRLN